MLHKTFTFKLTYFRPSGKFYSSRTVQWEIRAHQVDSSLPPTPHMPDAFAKVRGLRDCGGQGALPGLIEQYDVSDWPVLVECADGHPGLVLPTGGKK